MPKYIKLIISVISCELVGILGTPFTVGAIDTWYRGLNKPFFSPPNWIFGPVWTVLYLLMGISLYLVWIKGIQYQKVRTALTLFAIQLFLNFIWSLLFFGLRSPVLAFIDILALLCAIVLTMVWFHRLSKPAAYILIPYLLWVSFASLLNAAIILLN